MPGESPAADPGPAAPESSQTSPAPQPPAATPPADPPPAAPALPPPPTAASRPPLGLDREGLLEVAGGSVIALIALFSSYDHITIAGHRVALQQQWGVWLIAASLALVVVDAELATRSRSREKARLDREEYRFNREEYRHQRAEHSRQREALEADRERHRAAERAERQRQAAALTNRCALLSGRLQLDPSSANRDRFRAFLALMAAGTASDNLG